MGVGSSDFAWLIERKCSLEDYKDSAMKTRNGTMEKIRVWKVIEDCNYKEGIDDLLIMNEILDRIEYRAIYIKSEKFIEYENEKMRHKLNETIEGTTE